MAVACYVVALWVLTDPTHCDSMHPEYDRECPSISDPNSSTLSIVQAEDQIITIAHWLLVECELPHSSAVSPVYFLGIVYSI